MKRKWPPGGEWLSVSMAQEGDCLIARNLGEKATNVRLWVR